MSAADLGKQPASPCGQKWREVDLAGNGTSHSRGPLHAGLTKRELFAAMAMQGFLSNPSWYEKWDGKLRDMAFECLQNADALLAELAKPQEQQP